MIFIRKSLKVALIILIILIIVAFFAVWHMNHRALPDYNATVDISGLKGPVTVYRDSFAIPHIYAQNEEDLYMVVGYLLAQDRMWQMDLIRRVTEGRLSEIFGKGLLKTDILMRSLRIPEKSRRTIAATDPLIIKYMEAYADGVNQYITRNQRKLPIEFTILGYKPEKWKVEHSFNLLGYMAWDLNGSWTSEIILHKLSAKLSQEKIKDFIPDTDSIKSVIYSPQTTYQKLDWRSELVAISSKLKDLGLQVFHGSNNWAVSGKKTASGKAMLANDMHLGFSLPGIWYQMHQCVKGKLDVTGVALPGQPFIIAGHNNRIAWGMTNVMNDDIDFYRETIQSTDSLKYKLDGKWKDLIVHHEVIPVRGGDTVKIDLKFTHRGPIISKLKNLANETISMRWMGNEPSNEVRSIFLLNRAANWTEFLESVRTFNSVSQNVAYADIEGNIGLYCCAGIPIRSGNPIEVFPGDTTACDWQGIVPFEKLPHEYNPDKGYVVSANNRTIGTGYPYYISKWFQLPYRFDRITGMLDNEKKMNVSDMAVIQTDQTSKMAEFFLPGLIEIVKKQSDLTNNEKVALIALENWKAKMDVSDPAPAIFEVFYNNFTRNLLIDDLGETLYQELSGILLRNVAYNVWKKKSSALCDDIRTPDKIESFDDIVIKSYRQTISELDTKMGKEVANWKWGKIHTLTLGHPLGSNKILDFIFHFNRGPFEVGGSFHTIAAYSYKFDNINCIVTSGASQRQIYDLGKWDNSVSVIPAGNSGIVSNAYYSDQTQLYINGKYHRDLFSEELIKKSYKFKAVFVPK